MAESSTARIGGKDSDDKMDTHELRDLLSEWHLRLRCFENKDEREREELLIELEEKIQARFLEDRLDFNNIYNLLFSAHDVTMILENVSAVDGMKEEHLNRLQKLHDQLKASRLFECRKTIDLTEIMRGWSTKLEMWTSSQESAERLSEILDSFEDVSCTAYVWPGVLEKIKDLPKQWPDILIEAFVPMVESVQLLNKRLGEARDVNDLIPRPLVDRLNGMVSALEDALGTKVAIQDLVEINISTQAVEGADIDISFQGTEAFETGVNSLTKRPIERVRDLLLTKDSISLNNVDITTGDGKQIARERDGKLNIIVSHDIAKAYRLYHVYLKEDDEWRRIPATVQTGRLCVLARLPSPTMMFVTSTKIESESTLFPNKKHSHVCPELNDVVVDFSVGTVSRTQQINISLEDCKFPLSDIAGYSEIVCIQHDEKFLKPISVTLPVTMIGHTDITECDLFCVHIGDEGLSINEKVNVEILSGTVCRFATNTFGRNVIHARKKTKQNQKKSLEIFLQQLLQLHGQSCPHNILLFVGEKVGDDTWKLHAEIVTQSDVNVTIEKRQKEMALFELPQCRSPSLIVSGIRQIEVVLGANGSLSVWEGAQRDRVTISIIQGAADNFIQIPVTRRDRQSIGIVYFKTVGSGQILHSAFVGPQDMDKAALNHDDFARITMAESRSDRSNIAPLASPVSSSVSFDFFSDRSMHFLIENITPDKMFSLAICLGISHATYQNLRANHPSGLHEFHLNLIKYWLQNEGSTTQQKVETLCLAIRDVDLHCIAETVESVFKENRSLQRSDFKQ